MLAGGDLQEAAPFRSWARQGPEGQLGDREPREIAEGSRIAYGKIRKYLPIEIHPSFLEAGH